MNSIYADKSSRPVTIAMEFSALLTPIVFIWFTVSTATGKPAGIPALWKIKNPFSENDSDATFFITKQENGVLVKAIVKGDSPNISIDLPKNVKFYLYTRRKSKEYVQLYINGTEVLQHSGFIPHNKTKIIIHGFANGVSSWSVQSLKDAYLSKGDYNIIAVDWSDLSLPPFYNSAAENARLVGGYISEMIEFLIASGVDISLFHVIGHSLGAHVAGFIGLSLTPRVLPRITGLDPAKPLFDIETDENRLDKSDAMFVDCIHTSGGYLGVFEPTCTVNFYPNEGTPPQPGCTMDIFGTCSHQRSYWYFAESILSDIPFVAIKCTATGSNLLTNCNASVTTFMGENAHTDTSGIYYLKTSSGSPFASHDSTIGISTWIKFTWWFYAA